MCVCSPTHTFSLRQKEFIWISREHIIQTQSFATFFPRRIKYSSEINNWIYLNCTQFRQIWMLNFALLLLQGFQHTLTNSIQLFGIKIAIQQFSVGIIWNASLIRNTENKWQYVLVHVSKQIAFKFYINAILHILFSTLEFQKSKRFPAIRSQKCARSKQSEQWKRQRKKQRCNK